MRLSLSSFSFLGVATMALIVPRLARGFSPAVASSRGITKRSLTTTRMNTAASDGSKGKLLVLGGTGFLGQQVCQRAVEEGYSVVSLSRRGLPPSSESAESSDDAIEYRKGDLRQKQSITNVLENDSSIVGVVHCVGLLFDDASGLGSYNKFVSGSGSLPDADSTYETITRQTAFNAIEAATEYAKSNQNLAPLPFVFTSAAEAGWPDVPGGKLMDTIAPDFLKRYLVAKRAVEAKLLDENTDNLLRPVIVRPSLIYSMDRPASYVPVGAFFVGNAVGLPFVDRPVTVQTLASAIVKAIGKQESVRGVLRYPQIEELGGTSQ